MKKIQYVPRTVPMQHQKMAIEAARKKPNDPCPEDVFAFLPDTGTGKSKIILDEWGEMAVNGGPQDLLLLAPAGSYRNWIINKSEEHQSEINAHLNPEFRERLVDAIWVSGGNRDNKEKLRAMMEVRDRPRALVMNVEALSSPGKARDLVKEFLGQRRKSGSYFGIDESTVIRNPGAKRTKFITEIAEESDVRRIATGLLTPRSPLDAFAQFQFLDWRILGFKSFFAFKMRYAVTKRMTMGRRKFDVVVGYRNIDELQQLIAPYSYRILKEDCLDLPPKLYDSRDVELTDEQWRVYRELKMEATSMLEGGAHVTTDSIMQQLLRLHQVNLGFVVDEDGAVHELPENRTDALVQVLDEHRGKAVIWCPWRLPLDRVVKRLRKEYGENSVAEFHGGNMGTRANDEKRFLSDPECKYMCATQGAGMRGNTWTVADMNVYYANDHDLEKRYQSEDRIYRKGQTKKVVNMDLIVQGTVDMKIVKALRRKIDMATMITAEQYREWLI